MWWGLVCALLAAVAYGAASVMQAAAARGTEESAGGVDPRLLLRVLKQWRYLLGLGLDFLGFIAQLAALRVLPLFVVQAALAASLAVTAVAALALGVRLSAREWAAAAAVCVGLGLLGTAAEGESSQPVATAFHIALPVVAVALGGIGMLAGKASRRVRTTALGLVAGLLFGLVAVSGRVISSADVPGLLTDPATYAVVIAGVLAMLFYATALQRGSVTGATAMMVIGETVAPSAIGIFVLGDQTRAGFAPVAVVGFVLAIAAALALARFGEPAAPPVKQ